MMVDTAEWYPPLVCISWKLCFHFNLFFLLPQYWALLLELGQILFVLSPLSSYLYFQTLLFNNLPKVFLYLECLL